MTRALIYTRVSLDQTGEGRSVARQEEACRAFAQARGWEVVSVETDSQSAYDGKVRPAWERVLGVIERAEVDVVLAWHLDRMTRSMLDLERLISLAEPKGVGIATVSGDIDLTTDVGRMVARILAAVARAEVERKAARQRLANSQRAAEGKVWPSGPTLFGYGKGGVIVPGEAEAIREAVVDVLAGASLYSIARRWSEAGLFPRSTRRQAGAEPDWTPAGVKLLLVNPRLAGIATYRGEEVGRGAWEPIITESEHIQLKALLTDPARKVGGTSGPKPTTLLSTVAVCAKCGRTVNAGLYKGRPSYACKAGHVATPRFQADMLVTAEVVRHLAQATGSGAFRIETSGEMDLTEVDVLRERLDGLATAYAGGAITLEQLQAGSAVLRDKIAQAEDAAAAGPTSQVLAPEEAVRMFLGASDDGKRALLRGFEITLHPRGRGRRDVPITEQVTVTLRQE